MDDTDMELESEEEEDEDDTTINFKPSFVLIAIDTHPSMFQIRKVEDGMEIHPFMDTLTACYELADSLIFAKSRSNYSQFGVVLADEDQKASLIEVQDNLLDSVKLLKELCTKSNEELRTKYERAGDIDLAAFLLLCMKKFRDIGGAYYKRTIIYITNDDDPLKKDAQKRFAALNVAKTFEACDVSLELITMNADFNYTLFYNELFHLYSKPPTADEYCEDKDGLLEKLSSMIVFRYTKLRYDFFPFKDDYSRFLKVMKVNFIRAPNLINTHNASVDGTMVTKIEKDPIQYSEATQYGLAISTGDAIMFDLNDKHRIQASHLPLGFHLQYISNRQTDVGIVLSKVSILILDPKEELDKYFHQFWQFCVEKDKVLVCIKKYKNQSDIRYVELIPKYANNQRLFLIKDIPFSEEYNNIRFFDVPELAPTHPTEKQRGIIRQLVEQLTFNYEPKMFVDPCLAKRRAYIKQHLLEDSEEEVVIDPTADTDGIDEEIREVVAAIEKNFSLSGIPQGGKRKGASDSQSGRGRKAAK